MEGMGLLKKAPRAFLRLFIHVSRGVGNEQPFYPEALYIMVLSAFRKQEGSGEREGEHLGGSDGPPDAVHTEEQRKILKPASRKEKAKSRNAWQVSANSSAS